MLIAIPFYSNHRLLEETLKSLLNQTDLEFEGVVLDDSKDPAEAAGAKEILERLRIPQVRFHRNPANLGMAGNWNQALELAEEGKHDFLVILHADDRLLPDYVRRVKRELRETPDADAVFVRTRIINQAGRPAFSLADRVKEFIRPRGARVELRGVEGVGKLIPGDFIFCPSICYRVSGIQGRRFDGRRRQVLDFEWIVRSLFLGRLWVGLYDEPLFEYRRHSSNATKLQSEDFSRFVEEIEFYRELGRELERRGERDLARTAGQMWIVRFHLALQVVLALVRFRFSRAFRALEMLGGTLKARGVGDPIR